jgi:hypothetical protein
MVNLNAAITQIRNQRSQLASELRRLDEAISVLSELTGSGRGRRGRRRISAEGRARIAAAQRARWAKAKGQLRPKGVVPIRGKRVMSTAGRRRIAAAARARWAAWRRKRKAA